MKFKLNKIRIRSKSNTIHTHKCADACMAGLEIAFVYASFVFFSLFFSFRFSLCYLINTIQRINMLMLKILTPFLHNLYSIELYPIIILAKSVVEGGRSSLKVSF